MIGGFGSSAFSEFLCICSLSVLAVILIKGNEKRNRKWLGKGKLIQLNTKDKNKEQVDFVFYY